MRPSELIKQLKKSILTLGDLKIGVSAYETIDGEKTLICSPIDDVYVEHLKAGDYGEEKIIISKF